MSEVPPSMVILLLGSLTLTVMVISWAAGFRFEEFFIACLIAVVAGAVGYANMSDPRP